MADWFLLVAAFLVMWIVMMVGILVILFAHGDRENRSLDEYE